MLKPSSLFLLFSLVLVVLGTGSYYNDEVVNNYCQQIFLLEVIPTPIVEKSYQSLLI